MTWSTDVNDEGFHISCSKAGSVRSLSQRWILGQLILLALFTCVVAACCARLGCGVQKLSDFHTKLPLSCSALPLPCPGWLHFLSAAQLWHCQDITDINGEDQQKLVRGWQGANCTNCAGHDGLLEVTYEHSLVATGPCRLHFLFSLDSWLNRNSKKH